MKLIILFFVGIAIAIIPVYITFTDPVTIVDNFYLVFVAAIGVFLVILSVTKAMKKADRYLDK